jgi:CRISPR-associated endonuclease Csn1
MKLRIGIDVGERSVGLAAVEYDDDDGPIQILAAVSHIHDGGMDPDTSKSPKSRLATAGVARRVRRLTRNRRKRLRLLDEVLNKHGYPVPSAEVPQTHEAWQARARLVNGYINEASERDELIVLAARHIAHHRGWRNPWWSYQRLTESTSPTEQLTNTLAAAGERFGAQITSTMTLGQLVYTVAATGLPIRHTRAAEGSTVGALLVDQVRQEDSLAELRLIFETQKVAPDAADAICAAVFFQSKPKIPKDRIGKCDLQPDQIRAPIATLEFQEYRVRAAVGNLRIGREKRQLTEGEHDQAVEYLLTWRDEIKPRWRDVAELLGVSARDLTDPSLDGQGGSNAPYDRTSSTVVAKFKKSTKVGAWWIGATPMEHGELIDTICDLSGEDQESATDSVAGLLSLDDVLEDLDKLNSMLETGRASYSRDTLRQLNEQMREHRSDVHTARKAAFDVADDWAPKRPSLDDPIEHPTVARVNALVRRFLSTAVDKWGMPERIVIEHVRAAFAGPTGLAEIKSEIRSNTWRREKTVELLKAQGIEHPNDPSIKRNECVERQNCICLYCGTTITLLNCELDHIVPRAGGGGSRRDNLVAVCIVCNKSKGKMPFSVFAEHAKNPDIAVPAAQERVRNWQRSGMTAKSFRMLQSDVKNRLAMSSNDDEFGDRSIESTAYAAREMRARIENFLDQQAATLGVERGEVVVFSGIVTSEARKAGGIDDMIMLRSFTKKTRFDRRHHAIDATVLTSMKLGVAKTLKDRANLHRDNKFTGKDPGWKEYRGASPGEQEAFGRWHERMRGLGELIKQAIADDEIRVVRPLRLSPRVGAVHAETIEPLVRKEISEAFTQNEVLRIVNRSLFMRMSALAGDGDLDADPGRSAALRWAPDRNVDLFPSNAAYLAVRHGAVAIGGTVKHARVYAWRTKTGFDYGMVRMYVGEFPKIGFSGPGVDIFTAPLPAYSHAMRTANPTLRKRIESGDARQIGWLATDDELELEPETFEGKDTKLGDFMRAIPENRWTLTGFFASDTISIAPSYLASEGVDENTQEIVASVLKANRIPMGVNVIMGSPNCVIIRRTVTGAPRWHGDGLPRSWNVRKAAEQVFSS